MTGWIGAGFIAFVLFLVWCLCKAAADADRQMERMLKRKDDTDESGKKVSATDTKV